MSPTPAKRRFEPPSTLMHWTRLAPLLSATSRLDCIWIIDPVPSQMACRDLPRWFQLISQFVRSGRHFGRLVRVDALDHFPGLQLGNRRRLLDADRLAFMIGIALIMGVVLLRAADDLAVERVLY